MARAENPLILAAVAVQNLDPAELACFLCDAGLLDLPRTFTHFPFYRTGGIVLPSVRYVDAAV
jgi:hypothetical protein